MLTIGHLQYQRSHLPARLNASLGDVFGLRWLETELGVERERALHQVAFGESEKLGVHAFHVHEGKRTLFLLVCNPSKNVSDFDDWLNTLKVDGLARLFAHAKADADEKVDDLLRSLAGARPSRFIAQLQAMITESIDLIDHVYVRLLFFGGAESAGESQLFRNFEEDIRQRRHVIDERLDRPGIDIRCDVVSADGSRTMPDALKGFRASLQMNHHVRTEGPEGQLMHVGMVNVMELLEMNRKLGIRFLSRNVRAALDEKTGSNQALRKAFLEVARGAAPEYFLFRHNGVTLTARECEAHDGALTLDEPQVLNGAQTVTTLARVVDELRKNDEYTRAMAARLARIAVIGRVITKGSSAFVTSVTIASNRQNPIMPWHLRAHDEVQSALQAWFRDHLGLYYEVQEGSFESMTEEELEWHGIQYSDRCLGIKKLAQTFMAAEGMIDKMQQLKTAFEDDSVYQRVFCRGRMNAVPEDVVYCHKIDRRIGKMLRLLGGTDKYAFAKGARSLIWALLCQAFMNDRRHDQIASRHGRDLKATDDFTRQLERLAENHVRPLLVWIANHSTYADDVKNQKYSFLTTRRVFEACMEEARERWNWQHRRLGSCT